MDYKEYFNLRLSQSWLLRRLKIVTSEEVFPKGLIISRHSNVKLKRNKTYEQCLVDRIVNDIELCFVKWSARHFFLRLPTTITFYIGEAPSYEQPVTVWLRKQGQHIQMGAGFKLS